MTEKLKKRTSHLADLMHLSSNYYYRKPKIKGTLPEQGRLTDFNRSIFIETALKKILLKSYQKTALVNASIFKLS